ncbi:hypothetical protein QWY16_02115 [Planococcus shenhongbingii]|uniref:N-acetyltransferase domain-containing protein n=1 Tax=Planococcus shenhongbingii TaxID=3058398 RepID=A0ABT8NFK4_9BACL|nr:MULTISPECIES: hypothetical protein [unclassified Planococcus (in: firmicutes)]MDN7246663.1 hypothetical protein [Planococcus sp. N017]WKA58977.1 hypothetical protein QWY16_02115 [Planococcus sp. N016]
MKFLYEGTVTNQALRKTESMYMKRLFLEDLPIIEQVQKEVIESLPEKAALQPLSTEEFLFILNERGLLIGAFVEDQLIGFRALLIPEIDDEHLGLDLGLPEEELPNVIYQEISVVLPEYRGNRLQQKLAEVIMKELPNLEQQFRYVCCTVAPMNIPSLKDKFLQQMHIGALKEKYNGMDRYILVKDLEHPTIRYENHITVKLDDLEKQRQLLDHGYVGIGFQLVKGFHEIEFVKPVL